MKKFLPHSVVLFLLVSCGSADQKIPDSFVISADKMNVLYVGVSNPVSVSVPGFSMEQITVKTDNGTVSGKDGRYEIKVSTAGALPLQIFVKLKDGKEVKVGEANFRCKNVPDPVATFSGKRNDDIISIAELEKADGLIPMMQGFDFDLRFETVSFNIAMIVDGNLWEDATTTGSKLSDQQRKLITKAKAGSKIYIENVKIKGPDGLVRQIPGLTLKVI